MAFPYVVPSAEAVGLAVVGDANDDALEDVDRLVGNHVLKRASARAVAGDDRESRSRDQVGSTGASCAGNPRIPMSEAPALRLALHTG